MTTFKAPHNATYFPYQGGISIGVVGRLSVDTAITQYVVDGSGYDQVAFTKTGEDWHVHAERYDAIGNTTRTRSLPISEEDVPLEVRHLVNS